MNDHYLFARIVRQFLPAVRQQQALSPQQASACQNILNCHTAKLGGLDYVCDRCAHHFPRYHSCRCRHCPQCQQKASDNWVDKRMADVLPVAYFHLVFTLPHELNGWAQLHPALIYHLLFQSAWHTLNDYSQHNRQLQGQLGMTAVLHTWGQNLNQHVHLHCLIPGGAINEHGFTSSRRTYLYPHRVLAKLFRGKMVSALRFAWETGQLPRITRSGEVDEILAGIMKKDWVIHTKPHLAKPETVVRYLARYTHRTAITLSRIKTVDDTGVCFQWKDYRDGRHKMMHLKGHEFLRRFLLHVLPSGFMRIRHYGYLANRVRAEKLKTIRQWLKEEIPDKPAQTTESSAPCVNAPVWAEQCPKCQTGQLRLVGIILSEKERRRQAA